MAYYPAIFAYDVVAQLIQTIEGNYSVFHPLIHTALLGICFKTGNLIGSYSMGILLYSFLQMIIMSSIFSYATMYVSNNGTNKKAVAISLIFYGLFPVNSMLAISTVKDSLFAAFVLWFTIENFKLAGNLELINNKKWIIRICSSCLLMLLFRNNALYAFIISIPIAIFVLKGLRKKVLKLSIIIIILYLILSNILSLTFQAGRGNVLEMLSIPLQQISRVMFYESESLDNGEKDEILYYIPSDIVCNYSEAISDGVKNSLEETKFLEEPGRFMKLYIKLFIKYPVRYLEAFLIMTQGNWFLEDTSHANIYGSGLESRLGYLLTNHKQMPEGYEVVDGCYFPQLRNVYEWLFSANYYQKIPVFSFIFTPSLYWWLVYLYTWICLYFRKYKFIVAIVFLIGYYFTLLLGPTSLIRYMYPFIVCAIPVLFHTINIIKSNDEN